jgi:hypothetical protein
MKKMAIMGLVFLAGLSFAEQREAIGTLKGELGKTVSVVTAENKRTVLGKMSEDGKSITPSGSRDGVDASGIAVNDLVKVVVEGAVDEKGFFRVKKVISIEKQ